MFYVVLEVMKQPEETPATTFVQSTLVPEKGIYMALLQYYLVLLFFCVFY